MSENSFDRRDFLKAGASGALLAGVASQSALAENVADGPMVYFGAGDNTVYAVDAATGEQEWAFTEPSNEVESSPTVVDGTVYVGSWDNTLYAVDAATGEQEWAFTEPSDRVRSSPTVVDGTVYVGSSDGKLYAVDAATGDREWAFTEPSSMDSSPTVVDGTVYIGSRDNTLYAVDAATGEQEWAFTEPSNSIRSSPTVVSGIVYVGSEDETLYAVDAATGEQEWAFTEPSDRVRSSPTVVDGTVYVGSREEEFADGALYAVDAATGEQEWAFTEPGEIESSPTVVDGTVYVGSSYGDNTLYAVDAATGSREWTFTDPSIAILSSPTVVDGTVYVGSAGGDPATLYAVNGATGSREWAFTEPSDSIRSSPTVVEDSENGDSICSRVLQGTLGHHNTFAEQGPTEPGVPEPDLVASFSVTPETPETGETVTFDASQSEGDIEEDRWDFTDDGETDATGETAEYVFEEQGEFAITLTVVSPDGDEAATTETLEIESNAVEEFRTEKISLADRIETISMSGIDEKSKVEAIFDDYESLLEADEVDTEEAEQAVERLVLAEDVINRALEVTGEAEPRDEDAFDYNMAGETYAALFQGIVEWKLGIVEIKKKLAELSGYEEIINAALDYLTEALRDLITEQIGNTVRSSERIDFEEETVELAEEAANAYDLAEDVSSGDLRAIVERLIDPVATRFGNRRQTNLEEDGSSLLGDGSPGYADHIDTSLENTAPDVWDNESTYESSLDGARVIQGSTISTIDSNAQELSETIEPKHDGLLDLLGKVLDLLQAEGILSIVSILKELAQFIWDRIPIVAEGFNAGQGFAKTEFVVDDCYEGVSEIVAREQ